ncbi:hypothetical protein [Lyngbya sp. CCY1209]|uniref:hypothetical protein n=1 Tax=Lyngbya sp. CCY1209 TaxID=2886103 RepID=UPI002D1FCAEF|nr:hypothetical protein [Lyngbya sp. CCY1209]MEB3886164.1 hypothetical protein [Lyngbya sp. CCY1209]
MNYTALATLVWIIGGTLAPPATLSEPASDGPRLVTGSPVRATVDPGRPIVVQLANETDRLLNYARANEPPRSLPPGATGQLFLKVNPRRGETGSILINTPASTNPLTYEFHVDRDNVLRVSIRPTAADDPHQNRAIFIDERGRVYAF